MDRGTLNRAGEAGRVPPAAACIAGDIHTDLDHQGGGGLVRLSS